MAKKTRNSFIEGMDQDSSAAMQKKTKYYKGQNIKVLTEQGLSSGAIENEDGNIIAFTIPDTYGIYKIYFNDPENLGLGRMYFNYNHPTTGVFTTHQTAWVDNIEDLEADIKAGLSVLIGDDIKVVRNGEYIYLIPLTNNFQSLIGFNELSRNNGTPHVAAQTGLMINGWTVLRDEVVLFTTNETSATPSGAGQIWKFNIDPVSLTIDNLSSTGALTLSDHLMYNNLLDFSTYWHIGTEAIGHYENDKTGNVYWTDEYNNLRKANLLDPDLIGKSPGDLNIIENVDMSIPRVTAVDNGGSLPYGAVFQYAYRLFSVGGASTIFSPVSNPVPTGDFDPAFDDYDIGDGANHISSPNDKLITYSIEGIDTDFSVIEHIAIVTTNSGQDIYKFKEQFIPKDGTVEVQHVGLEPRIVITPEEFTALTRTFKKCKTIAVKDKRLIAANLSTEDVSIDGYDSRAYRFNSSNAALLTDKEEPSVPLQATAQGIINSSAFDNVPAEHDAINSYNADNLDTPSLQYKYKADGKTLGGQGKYISYTFAEQDIPLKSTVSGQGLDSNGNTRGIYTMDGVRRNYQSPIGAFPLLNGEQRGRDRDWQNFKGPTMAGAFTGYARGETYRFGIVFYDKASNPFNVKWIGDIKFPEHYDLRSDGSAYGITPTDVNISAGSLQGPSVFVDGDGSGINNQLNSNTPIMGKSIGIEFDINVSSIQDKISGYEIVRVHRGEADKSRLGTGIYNDFKTTDVGGFSAQKRFNSEILGSTAAPSVSGTALCGVSDNYYLDVNGTNSKVHTLGDHPGTTSATRTGVVISPEMIMRSESGYTHKSGDILKTVGFYADYHEAGTRFQGINRDDQSGRRNVAGTIILGHQWRPSLVLNTTNASLRVPEYREVETEAVFNFGAEAVVGGAFDGPNTLGHSFLNTSPGNSGNQGSDNDPAGIGDIKSIVDLVGIGTNLNPWQYYTPTLDTGSDQRKWWREVSYQRTPVNAYGGNTFEARSANAYISCGAYESVKETFSPTRTFRVYGGDTFVTQFWYQYYASNWTAHPSYGTPNHKYHLGMAFPCESTVNTTYQSTGHYATKSFRDFMSGVDAAGNQVGPGAIGGFAANYNVPSHYQLRNTVKGIYFPPAFVNNFSEESPHGIWASEVKLDGELLDSWRVWLPNNFTEVEGQFGEINKVVTHKDKFYFYQDRAFGTASINDRSVINDENGVELTVGSGGILDDYGYISRITGTKHKFSVVPTENSIHHFDTNFRKWYRYSGGITPLSDIKGMHSFFRKFDSNLLKDDRILQGTGIHGVYDKVRNKVFMTFLNANTTEVADTIDPGTGGVETFRTQINNYTLSYNENIQAFESLYDNKPYLWLENSGKLLSTAANLTSGWLNYEGDKNKFYGTVYDSELELIIAPNRDIAVIFNNIEYKGEIFINDIDQSALTFDTLQVLNDHQDSGLIALTVDGNIRRRFRSWKADIPRDSLSANGDARIRDYYMKLILKHTPGNNERLVLHDIITSFRDGSK